MVLDREQNDTAIRRAGETASGRKPALGSGAVSAVGRFAVSFSSYLPNSPPHQPRRGVDSELEPSLNHSRYARAWRSKRGEISSFGFVIGSAVSLARRQYQSSEAGSPILRSTGAAPTAAIRTKGWPG